MASVKGAKSSTVRREKSIKSQQRGFKIYAVNFHGTGLNAIRDRFIDRINDGLRRHVFVIDMLEEEQKQNDLLSREESLTQSGRLTGKKKATTRASFSDNIGVSGLLNIALNAIRDRQRRYMEIMIALEKEEKFDLVSYLIREPSNKEIKKRKSEKSIKSKVNIKDNERENDKIRESGTKKKMKETEEFSSDITCPDVVTSQHNIVGNPKSIMNRKYIDDDPQPEILYIVLIGKFSNDFYNDLINAGQPLQAVINFLPEEGVWERLAPRLRKSHLIKESIQKIQNFVCNFRQSSVTKSVGVLQTQLPIISFCMAKKYQTEIFNELTWYLYDIEILLQQYYLYYFEFFQIADVELPIEVSLFELLEAASILSINGHYMCRPLLGTDDTDATFVMYIDMLLNAVEEPFGYLNENDINVFSEGLTDSTTTLNKAVEQYRVGFQSTTKIERYDRLFVEECNTLLTSLIMHSTSLTFRSIFRTVLEYNLLRKYTCTSYIWGTIPFKKFDEDYEVFTLPPYAKFYATDDSVLQRLNKLINEFEDYEVDEIKPGHKLYYFRRTFNEIFEHEKRMVIPTRLCFRDFTIFQMEEFLQNLVTPELRIALKDAGLSTQDKRNMALNEQLKEIDSRIFIRPEALKTKMYASEGDIRAFGDCAQSCFLEECAPEEYVKRTQFSDHESFRSNEYVGLRPGISMLNGYNLEDIRQIIRFKTSKYYFEEGFFKLFEECWNFHDVNRVLEWQINTNKINLVAPRSKTNSISHTIRITTLNDVTLRILNVEEECAKMILNYPNGLSIIYLGNYIEQIWSHQETFSNEKKRFNTPYGAVIVYYLDAKMITIMRYNGEVYRLYQYVPEGEEEEFNELDDFSNIDDSSSHTKSLNGKINLEFKTNLDSGHRKKGKKGKGSESEGSRTDSNGTQISEPEKTFAEQLKESIAFENDYLTYLAKVYKLNWLYVSVTTSDGRIINISGNGDITASKPLIINEWHDYYLNESYTERSDCVRLIWDCTTLKCYHADGTVIMTNTQEVLENIYEDEFDSRISTSSSHERINLSEADGESPMDKQGNFPNAHSTIGKRGLYFPGKYLNNEDFEGELEETPDPRYVKVSCTTFIQHHVNYGSVYIICQNYYAENIEVFIEVWAFDGIRLNAKKCLEVRDIDHAGTENLAVESVEELLPFTESKSENDVYCHQSAVLTIWIGDFFYLYVTERKVELCSLIHRYNDEYERYCDCIDFCFDFKSDLKELFLKFTDKIARFKNYAGSQAKVYFFLEKLMKNCGRQGFEFIDDVPPLGIYNFSASNTITEFTPIKTINERFENCFSWFCKDMAKFPRFSETKNENNVFTTTDLFPWVFRANFYVQIPRLLRTTNKIHLFLQPMETVNFKKLRNHFNEAVIYHIRPQIRLELRRYISYISWKIRKQQHIRRLLVEQQRKGLYHAMLRYKEFPNYFNFMDDFNGKTEDIDFFEFMLERCHEGASKDKTFPPYFPRDDRKKCYCPKYVESLVPPKKRGCCKSAECV